MVEAQGILTARGGKTSHAAIVAVGMGKPAVCGVSANQLRRRTGRSRSGSGPSRRATASPSTAPPAGSTPGDAPLLPPDPSNPYLLRIIEWADRARTLRVRANADTPEDAARAREFGAEGIGLCRTEHMFQGEDRLPIVQRMILAGDDEARVESLAAPAHLPGGRLRGHLPRHGRPAGHHPAARPAAPRVPAQPGRAVRARRRGPRDRHARPRGRGAAARRSSSCTRSTRCWARGAAAWASSGRTSTGCRSRRS